MVGLCTCSCCLAKSEQKEWAKSEFSNTSNKDEAVDDTCMKCIKRWVDLGFATYKEWIEYCAFYKTADGNTLVSNVEDTVRLDPEHRDFPQNEISGRRVIAVQIQRHFAGRCEGGARRRAWQHPRVHAFGAEGGGVH